MTKENVKQRKSFTKLDTFDTELIARKTDNGSGSG